MCVGVPKCCSSNLVFFFVVVFTTELKRRLQLTLNLLCSTIRDLVSFPVVLSVVFAILSLILIASPMSGLEGCINFTQLNAVRYSRPQQVTWNNCMVSKKEKRFLDI